MLKFDRSPCWQKTSLSSKEVCQDVPGDFTRVEACWKILRCLWYLDSSFSSRIVFKHKVKDDFLGLYLYLVDKFLLSFVDIFFYLIISKKPWPPFTIKWRKENTRWIGILWKHIHSSFSHKSVWYNIRQMSNQHELHNLASIEDQIIERLTRYSLPSDQALGLILTKDYFNTVKPFVQSPYQNWTDLGRLKGTGQRVLHYNSISQFI